MSKIRLLSDVVANQIAAGEIVERPASVVKELVENSIDAGSLHVEVEVDGGGKSRIVVRDDGEGMDRDDALLAFEHHATSKILASEDLSHISTLGFRGEALPSIGSVSRVLLRTAPSAGAEGGAGVQLEISGGVLKDVREIAWARGTEIEVRDLFFNLPARRKFMRAETTESAHVARLVTHYALARQRVRFSLEHNGRTVLDALAAESLEERVSQVFGCGFLDDMVPVRASDPPFSVSGYVSGPHRTRSSTGGQYLFVNGRMVRDRAMTGALFQAYRGLVPSGAYPAAILFLEAPPGEIDVNVHPAKTEVRFRDGWRVQNFLARELESAVRGGRVFASMQFLEGPADSDPPAQAGSSREMGRLGPAQPQRALFPPRPEPGISGSGDPFQAGSYPRTSGDIREAPVAFPERRGDVAGASLAGSALSPGSPTFSDDLRDARPVPSGGWVVLGQWRGSYIVAAKGDELFILDQHAAHERVLFESYLSQLKRGAVPRQRLLTPIPLELTPAQEAVVEELSGRLGDSGFETEPFGHRTLLVKAVPAIASGCEVEGLISGILEMIESPPDRMSLDDVRRRVAAGLACRAAVKIKTPLSHDQMGHLLDGLMAADDPVSCPHGRPVVLRLHAMDIEKGFLRR